MKTIFASDKPLFRQFPPAGTGPHACPRQYRRPPTVRATTGGRPRQSAPVATPGLLRPPPGRRGLFLLWRRLLGGVALSGLVLLALTCPDYAVAGAGAKTEIRFAFIGDESGSAYDGVKQGIHEANLQGRFSGQSYSLHVFAGRDIDKIDPAGFIAIIVAANADELQQAGRRFKDHAVLNVSAHDDALRKTCVSNLLHVIPSKKMLDDAKAQWLQKAPGAEARASGWHHDFVKFAARDLNKRFRKGFARPMDQYAWAGWAAVKMTSDSVARKGLTSPAALLDHLKTDLSFDGQKGLDMNFRDTGQLRQLLLISNAAGELVGEAPVRGVVKPNAVDSLGLASCYTKGTSG